MPDLSDWDIATDFTGDQIAALILGIDPRQSDFKSSSAEPALKRVKEGYVCALKWHYGQVVDFEPMDAPLQLQKEMFESLALKREAALVTDIRSAHDFVDWLHSEAALYENQRFSREDVIRWLAVVGLRSRYRFAAGGQVNEVKASLSTTERNTLLKMVIGMAIKGYGYDPNAPRSEIPKVIADDLSGLGIDITDDTVRKWLRQARDAMLPKAIPKP